MKIEDIRRILVIGAGTMGQEIGLQCATHGYHVVLYDIAPDMLQTATRQIDRYLAGFVEGGYLTSDAAAAARDRITTTLDPQEAGAEADLVSEAVPEDPELKGRVFAQFNQICPQRTIFTTNTSTLVPSLYAEATGRPAQFAALHFHLDVWESNVVDVMPHPGTSAETVDLLMQLAKRIGQIPILIRKETNSYVFNRILSAINTESLALAADGIATVEDVDRAWMGIMKMPVGPFGIMDKIGLDTIWHIVEYWAGQLPGDTRLRANADFLKHYVDQGRLGLKNGRGFYNYPEPAFARPGFLLAMDASNEKE